MDPAKILAPLRDWLALLSGPSQFVPGNAVVMPKDHWLRLLWVSVLVVLLTLGGLIPDLKDPTVSRYVSRGVLFCVLFALPYVAVARVFGVALMPEEAAFAVTASVPAWLPILFGLVQVTDRFPQLWIMEFLGFWFVVIWSTYNIARWTLRLTTARRPVAVHVAAALTFIIPWVVIPILFALVS